VKAVRIARWSQLVIGAIATIAGVASAEPLTVALGGMYVAIAVAYLAKDPS
jgi:hypothetical protein